MRPPVVALRLYRALARAYPQEFRNVYGDEMTRLAEEDAECVWRQHGLRGLLALLLDVALRLPVEYLCEMRRDVRQGIRVLKASPGFTIMAILSLALGMGFATSAYSERNGMIRDLPGVPEPERLVALRSPVSYPTYRSFRELQGVFTNTFAYLAPIPLEVWRGGKNERLWGQLVTPSYFPTLGVLPRTGRFFDAADDAAGRTPSLVVSQRFWEERLGSDPGVIGRSLRVNGQACVIVGVAREEFQGASPTLFPADLWLPLQAGLRVAPEFDPDVLERRDLALFQMAGRLRPGVSDGMAQAQLNVAAQQLAEFHGDPDRLRKEPRIVLLSGGKILPIRKQDIPFFTEFLMILGSLLLLIACANLANMMLARAAERRREIAVRLSVGASRGRLIRQLLTESLLLSAAATPFALLFCYWAMSLMSHVRMPVPVPVELNLHPDGRVLAFTFVVMGATSIAFGLIPALQATRTDLISALKEGGDRRVEGPFRRWSWTNALVLCQMAASLMLLLMTGYLGLGIQSTLGVQEGFDPRNLYLISFDPVRDGYPAARAAELLDELVRRVGGLPGIRSACLTDTLPVATDGNPGVLFSGVSSEPARNGREANWARRHTVGRDYFRTAGIPILSGREFQKPDETGRASAGAGSAVVVVSEEAVRRFWNGADPVGRRIEIRNAEATPGIGLLPGTVDSRSQVRNQQAVQSYEVVGVASDVSEDLLASKRHPAVYFPLAPGDVARPSLRGVTLMVRSMPGVDVVGAVEREMAKLDPAIVPFQARGMAEHIDQFMSALRAASWTYGLLGCFGLVLAAVGLAGVTAHAVARRGHEIGIRMALGAQRGDVLWLVMRRGVALVAAGIVAGMMLALAGVRAMSGFFFSVASVQSHDPVLLIGAPVLLGGLALMACYLPARRSTRIDPLVSLRVE